MGYDAVLEVSQAAHQALNFRATNLRSLGFEERGGLLGTGEHDRLVEMVSDQCKAFRANPVQTRSSVRAEMEKQKGPSMAAYWD